jgi:F-type H+-transporting ATPase subunit b
MTRWLRWAALFGLLGICLAGFGAPTVMRAEEPAAATKEQESEPPHELLYKTINFIILVGGLGYILRKPAAEFFDSRSASIRNGLEEGRKALEASQAQLRVVEEKLKGLEGEIAAFKASAQREMEAEGLRLKQAGEEEAARILESARNQTAVALRAAKLELKRYAAQKSVALAEGMIRTQLDDTARKRLVTQFASTIGAKDQKN